MKLQFSRHVFEKYANIKFHENPSSRSRVVPCGWTDSRTDMTKPIVSFRNFANASKNVIITKILYYSYNICSFFGAFSYTLQNVYYNNTVFTPICVKQLQGQCENLVTFDCSGGHPVYFSNSIHSKVSESKQPFKIDTKEMCSKSW
jgi:hypothetical protein